MTDVSIDRRNLVKGAAVGAAGLVSLATAAQAQTSGAALQGKVAIVTGARNKLAQRADRSVKPSDHRYHLSPSARRAVVDYVEAHLPEDCALFALAEVAKLSPYHFARAFRADTGDTPHQFVLRRRISRAQQLLKHSEQALTQVALDCGFSSQQRMNDAFSRQLGISPGRYRQALSR